ncbi:hypothetical protein [Taibaiella koreensis]|uniref:hypothetical protein n=1 Tax=Taibaiella koreensis TaxID=1268548 RepID=UPI000E599889|nr:hypothetical protein [Taibaiella koreensis]
MKFVVLPLLIVLCSYTAFAGFAGWYILPSRDNKIGDAHLILEESGHFYMFCDHLYRWGTWRETDRGTAALVFGKIDAVAGYVYGNEQEQERFVFGGFGDKQGFASIGKKGSGEKEFTPIFKKEPACPYDNAPAIVLPQKGLDEITVALRSGSGEGKDGPADCYTFALQGRNGNVSVIVDNDAFLEQPGFSITLKDKQYMVGDATLEKQNIDLSKLPGLLDDRRALWRKARIDWFRKEYYVREEKVTLLEPVVSRNIIQVAGDPLFSGDCPEADPFPPVVPVKKPD